MELLYILPQPLAEIVPTSQKVFIEIGSYFLFFMQVIMEKLYHSVVEFILHWL